MLRQFAKDSVIYGVSGVLARAVSVFLLPLYTRVLTPDDYGVTDILMVVASFVHVTIALEISQGFVRYFADSRTPAEKVGYASTAMIFTVGVYTLFTAIAWILAGPLSQWLFNRQALELPFMISMLSIWVYGIMYLAQNQLRIEMRPGLLSISSLVATIVAIGTTVFLVLEIRLGVLGVLYGQLAGYMVGAVLAVCFARPSYRLEFDSLKWREMIGFSLPFVPSSIAVISGLYVDRVALNEFASLSDVGIYGVGYRLASVVGLLMVAFQSSLGPLILTKYRQPEAPEELARIFRYFMAFLIAAFLGLSIFARDILTMLTPLGFHAAADVVPLLVPAIALAGMASFAPGLILAKKTRYLSVINIAVAGLNLACNYFLIRQFGIIGAALAGLLSSLIGFTTVMVLSQKFYPVPHRWLPVILSVVAAAALVAADWAIDRDGVGMIPSLEGPARIFSKSLLLGVGLVAAFFTLIGYREVKTVLRRLGESSSQGNST